MSKCKILFLAANPAGTDRLSLDEESRAIDEKIRAAEHRDAFELVTKWAVRPDDLLENLNRFKPHVVHFSGHGTEANEIILEDHSRKPKPVSAAALRQLFTVLKDNIHVVVLNACFSRTQAEAIVQVIDCAIGMKSEIGDEAAVAFAASFYRAVGYGRSVRDAFEQGKAALMLHGIPEEDTPTLLVGKGVDPAAIFLVSGNPKERAVDVEPIAEEGLDESNDDSGATQPQPTLLNEILPGAWQVQIQLPFAAAQMRLEVFPNGQFRGELTGPMGVTSVDGQWQVNPFARQIGLQGRQSNGFQVGPYAALIQVTYFDAQQIVGVTSGNEQVTWHKTTPPPAPLRAPQSRPPKKSKTQPPKL